MAKARRTTAGGASPAPRTLQPQARQSGAEHPPHYVEEPAGRATLALHVGLPGAQLDMVLGGRHPLFVELVRSLARTAAQGDHVAELAADGRYRTRSVED